MNIALDTRARPACVLVTGGAGFIGSNLVRYLLEQPGNHVVINLDALTYAGNRESLLDVERQHGLNGTGRYAFVRGDIRDKALVEQLLGGMHVDAETRTALPQPDAVLHLAAESHVDRSISGPQEFVSTNVSGTLNLLDCVHIELQRSPREFRFVNVSTDEVYGSLGPKDPAFTEKSPLLPNSPYSASKAGADCLVRAFHETYGLPCMTTRCSNNYGPFQFPEKLIPLMISRAIADKPLPVYGDGLNIRDWLHVVDHCAAIWRVCLDGRAGCVYNIGGQSEARNIDLVRRLLDIMGKSHSLISFVQDRPGHDRRYAIDSSTIESELGWRPTHDFASGLATTVDWYLSNQDWWRRLLVNPA